MRTLLFSLAACFSFFSEISEASEPTVFSTQTNVAVAVDVPFNPDRNTRATVGWYNWASYLLSTGPQGTGHLGFFYTGPSVAPTFKNPKVFLWFAPVLTVALNQFEGGSTGIGPSAWIFFEYDKKISFFLETDYTFNTRDAEESVLYGFYQVSGSPLPWLGIGGQVEIFGSSVGAGPQVSFNKGHFTYKVMAFGGTNGPDGPTFMTFRQMIYVHFP